MPIGQTKYRMPFGPVKEYLWLLSRSCTISFRSKSRAGYRPWPVSGISNLDQIRSNNSVLSNQAKNSSSPRQEVPLLFGIPDSERNSHAANG
jgi:hypothetical protein